MSNNKIHDATKEAGYAAQRGSLWVLGKHSAEMVGESVGRATHAITPHTANHAAVAASGLSGMGGLLTIGIAAAVSAGLTQLDYVHRKDALKDMYKEELSAHLNKPIHKLKRGDLDTLAKSNKVLREELNRDSRRRYFGMALSITASMAALAVVTLALPAVVGAALGITAAAASQGFLATFGGFLLKAAVGLATYYAVKEPLHGVADRLFDIDKHTVNDRIVGIGKDIQAGKTVSQEEVLAVFAAAHPQLDKYIRQQYGKRYDDLTIDDKHHAVQELNQHLPLEQLTQGINSGRINPTELAFAVEGKESGVDHLLKPVEEKKGFLALIWEKVTGRGGAETAAASQEYVMPLTNIAAQAVVMHEKSETRKGFVEKLGLSRKDTSLGHVERVDQNRETSVPGITQP